MSNIIKSLNLKRQPHKMVKHTQTIRRQKSTNCLNVFDHFVGLALKELIWIPSQVSQRFNHYQ